MPWEYSQSTGQLRHNGQVVGRGYSGHGGGRNNPAMETTRGVGPIPRGRYSIGRPHHSPNTGPQTMNLEPVGHGALGRTLLRIHGDNRRHDASHGCVILGPEIRHRIAASHDAVLDVVR